MHHLKQWSPTDVHGSLMVCKKYFCGSAEAELLVVLIFPEFQLSFNYFLCTFCENLFLKNNQDG